jgi:hypothetical protein
VYFAVSVLEPAARDAAGIVIVAEPELSAAAADV